MNWGEAIRRLGSLERQRAEYLARARRRAPTQMERDAMAGMEREITRIRAEIDQRFTSSRLLDIAKQSDPHLRKSGDDGPARRPRHEP